MDGKICKFSYGEIDDSLIVSCKEDNENVKERFNLGNFIFHLTGRGKIVGMNILNASKVLLDYNLDSEVLKKLEGVKLVLAKNQGLLGVALILSYQNQQGKITIPLININQSVMVR